jgi:hypothetical protein
MPKDDSFLGTPLVPGLVNLVIHRNISNLTQYCKASCFLPFTIGSRIVWGSQGIVTPLRHMFWRGNSQIDFGFVLAFFASHLKGVWGKNMATKTDKWISPKC